MCAMVRRPHLVWVIPVALFAAACTGGFTGGPGQEPEADGGVESTPLSIDGGMLAPDKGVQPNWDAFFANDPPPQYCGPTGGGGTPPPLPGGTPDCPDDKNREGCPCAKQGEVAACWPGLRKNRNRGICKDGTTVCQLEGEHLLRWGPCKGYVLPVPGVTKGPQACTCFSKGTWKIDNLSPCFVDYGAGQLYAVSTYVDSSGKAKCPTPSTAPPPQPEPGQPWSTNTLTVDCAGQFKLCYTIKAGDYNNPSAADCVLAQACTSVWYAQKDTPQTLTPLPAWSAKDPTCVAAFEKKGGYGEMSVIGQSIECDAVDDNGAPLVFLRVSYCPLACNTTPSLPGCANCGNGASGSF
jgi:hypothetical protein